MLGLLLAVKAEAHTEIIEPPGAHFPYQRWVDEAGVPTPDTSIEVVETAAPHGCPLRAYDYMGCTAPSLGIVWLAPEAVAKRTGMWRSKPPRFVFLHELGHNVDFVVLPEWMRDRFMRLVGVGPPWRVEGEPEPWGPSELFANAWAECAVQPHSPVWAGPGSVIYGPKRHNAICRMLAKLPG